MLALNVRDLTWAELFLPLKLEQSAPMGLLLLSKACITVLGPSEMAFRLPVFVIFLASLRIIYKRNDIFSEASIVFIFLTSFFIYYSSEFKQYMFDCYAGIMVLAFVRDANYRGAIVFLTVFLWFSHATMVLLPPVLLLYIIFFTFLTGYALFSGKTKTCGCFGDCIPLTPAMSFGKDILLLVLILFSYLLHVS